MGSLDAFIKDHFMVIWCVAFGVTLVNLGWRFYKRRKSGISFPRDSVWVLFHESMASGNSDKTFFSKLGGAKQCLRVTVTEDEVWVYSFFPLYLITESDLEHRIPRSAVVSVAQQDHWAGRRVLLDFRLPEGGVRRLSLVLKNPEGFVTAVRGADRGQTDLDMGQSFA